MPIKSRGIILKIMSTAGNQTKVKEYKLRGVEKISYAFDNAVGITQGITKNFIHPWFLKTFTITLQGAAYIGAFKNLADATENNLPAPIKPQESIDKQMLAQDQENKQAEAKKSGIINFNYFKNIFTTPTVPDKSSEYYYKTQQLLRLMEDIAAISDSISSGSIKILDVAQVKQVLTITNYYDVEQKSLSFVGFIEKLDIEEDVKQLGVLNYTLTFTGIVETVAMGTAGKKRALDLLSLVQKAGKGINTLANSLKKSPPEETQ